MNARRAVKGRAEPAREFCQPLACSMILLRRGSLPPGLRPSLRRSRLRAAALHLVLLTRRAPRSSWALRLVRAPSSSLSLLSRFLAGNGDSCRRKAVAPHSYAPTPVVLAGPAADSGACLAGTAAGSGGPVHNGIVIQRQRRQRELCIAACGVRGLASAKWRANTAN